MIGLILVLIAAFKVTNSVWTAPLLIVGALMLIVAWIGARLDGRIGIVWGEDGTEFEMRARLKPYRQPALVAGDTHDAPRVSAENTIDGEAHTMAIDVEELKAMIAALEAAEPPAEDVRSERPADFGLESEPIPS